MRKLLFILITIPLIGVAQLSKDKEAEVDSLQQVIKKAKHDTTILNAWIAWEKTVYKIDTALFLELNRKVDSLCSLNLKKELSRKERECILKTKSRNLNYKGAFCETQGYFEKAAEYCYQSIAISDKIGNKKSKARALIRIGEIFRKQGNYDKAIGLYEQSIEISKDITDKTGMAISLNRIGVILRTQGDFNKAIDYYLRSIKISNEIDDKKMLAISFNSIGIVYSEQGNYNKAIDYFSQSIKLDEDTGDKHGISSAWQNIGGIYIQQGDYGKAMDIFTKSIKLDKEIGNKLGISNNLNNMGLIHKYQGDYDTAMDYFLQHLSIAKDIGNQHGIATALNNIGTIYKYKRDFEMAIDFFSKSLKIVEEIGYQMEIPGHLVNIGEAYFELGEYEKALSHNNRALVLAKKMGTAEKIKLSTYSLWKIYKKIGNHKKSLEMFELYTATKDSINSIENQKAVIRQEYQYQYEKKAATDSIMAIEEIKIADALLAAEKAENKQHQIEAIKQQEEKYFLFGGLALALIFGGFIFNRFRITAKQKLIIEGQKEKVDEAFDQLEEKNQEILASINYAKRIQSAILPPARIVKEYLKDSFILYKPKDIVAGDFYWLEQRDGKIMFAAADCTGHGVPGAMVSVVCNNGLNRSVREHGLTDPGKILDKTREIVVQEFEKSEEGVQDGMDIALCSLENKKLRYAGAHNPLWIIRKGEVLETKADKQPIGKFRKPQPYTTHTFELEKGDAIYIFSDGYVDQFGGEKEKKFKSKAFKKLLLSIQDKTMEQQKIIIDDTFENWKGELEQIDDVCVIGVKI